MESWQGIVRKMFLHLVLNEEFFRVIWYNITSMTSYMFTREIFYIISNQCGGANYFIRSNFQFFCGWIFFEIPICVDIFSIKT